MSMYAVPALHSIEPWEINGTHESFDDWRNVAPKDFLQSAGGSTFI